MSKCVFLSFRRTLAELREELVSEKLSGQQKQVELEKLHEELSEIGINKEELLQLSASIDIGDRYSFQSGMNVLQKHHGLVVISG